MTNRKANLVKLLLPLLAVCALALSACGGGSKDCLVNIEGNTVCGDAARSYCQLWAEQTTLSTDSQQACDSIGAWGTD